MAEVVIPQFGQLLARHLQAVDEAAMPYLAGAWQRLKSAHPDHADALDELSAIELRSADHLDQLLDGLS